MRFIPLLGLALSIALTYGNELRIRNNCRQVVSMGLQNNPGNTQPLPANGGFTMLPGTTRSVQVQSGWAGRVWGRTNCGLDGHCETGDCGNKIECQGAGGVPPVSLAEITFDGAGGMNFYDISLVDGYNLPITMAPIPGTFNKGSNDPYDCTKAGCTATNTNLNAKCPDELRVKNSMGSTVGCMSACEKFNTDEYCCRGAYGTPQTCKTSDWPVNYAAKFKEQCPNAVSYVYDDSSSAFTCKGKGASGFEIVMCP